MDIHNYEKNLQSRMKILKESNVLSERNKKFILDFVNVLVIDNLSKPRLMKYLEILRILGKKLDKDFDKATKEDLMKIVGEIQRKDYSPWTKQTYKVILRRFYKWLYGMKESKDYPEIVSWVNIRMNRAECRLPSDGDLLTQEEVEKMIESSTQPRDKALIAVLWESGARISEIGTLTFKQVKFDKHGVILTVKGKTGSRPIRLIWGVSYLSTWLNSHPFRNEKSSPIWINIGSKNHRKPMSYSNIRQLFVEISRRSEIKKRIHPHLFRHSRATFMANYLTEFQMNKYFGWIQGSKMPATYVHMSGKNLDDAILQMNGLQKKEDEEETRLQPKICPRCNTINSHDTKYCNKCGGVVDLKEAMEMDERFKKETRLRTNADKLMDVLLKDEDVKEMLMEKLGGLGSKAT